MEIRKICRLLTFFFVILNVLFVTLYYIEYRSAVKLDDEFAEDAVKNLSDRGIEVSTEALDLNVPQSNAYSFELPESKDFSLELANRISDFAFDNKTESVSFDVPDGISVSIYEAVSSDEPKELAKLLVNQSQYYFNYSDSGYVLKTPLPDGVITTFEVEVTPDMEKCAESFINSICPKSSYGYEITGCIKTLDGIVVSVRQTIDDRVIQDVYLNIALWDSQIIAAKGKWICEPTSNSYKNTLIDGINVLYKLDLDNIVEIKKQEIIYAPRSVDEKQHYLLPVWEISYKDKNGSDQKICIDALK